MYEVGLHRTNCSYRRQHCILCEELIFVDLWGHKHSGRFPSPNHCLATVATRMNAACLWSALNGQFTTEKKG